MASEARARSQEPDQCHPPTRDGWKWERRLQHHASSDESGGDCESEDGQYFFGPWPSDRVEQDPGPADATEHDGRKDQGQELRLLHCHVSKKATSRRVMYPLYSWPPDRTWRGGELLLFFSLVHGTSYQVSPLFQQSSFCLPLSYSSALAGSGCDFLRVGSGQLIV